jgi:diguanylate cyclase (GGDEF)-like protein
MAWLPGRAQRAAAGGGSSLMWLYVLAMVPVITDVIETGRLPRLPREWLTEVVAGAVIALLVRRVRRDHAAALLDARRDPLTSLLNRRAFGEELEWACARARRFERPLCLVCIDLDDFKSINDGGGHDTGDLALRQLADTLAASVRQGVDLVFRLGGDEFALLLPDTLAAAAEVAIERLRRALAARQPVWAGVPLAISAGVVELGHDESAAAFASRADAAMYAAKRARRG